MVTLFLHLHKATLGLFQHSILRTQQKHIFLKVQGYKTEQHTSHMTNINKEKQWFLTKYSNIVAYNQRGAHTTLRDRSYRKVVLLVTRAKKFSYFSCQFPYIPVNFHGKFPTWDISKISQLNFPCNVKFQENFQKFSTPSQL